MTEIAICIKQVVICIFDRSEGSELIHGLVFFAE